MVHVINCSWDEFLSRAKLKRIFCFGAGRMFARFGERTPSLSVEGVIDNFCSERTIRIAGKEIPVVSFEKFLKTIHDSVECVIVITSQNYKEMLLQLDAEEELTGIECYLQLLMEDAPIRKEELMYYLQDGRNVEANVVEAEREDNYRRVQICDVLSLYDSNAGSKAPYDIQKIAAGLGYKRINVHFWIGGNKEDDAQNWSIRQNQMDWQKCYDMMPRESILLVQMPCRQLQSARHETIFRLRKEKDIKIISIIHDIESLRVQYNNEELQKEFIFMVDNSDFFIVHTHRMKDYFTRTFNISSDRVESLQIFDYLMNHEKDGRATFDKSITVAGNLDPFKSRYVYRLKDLGVKLNLFGSGYVEDIKDSCVTYHGVYPVDRIPFVLTSGFGLVWDGDSLDTCAGYTGQYLRYNSPHKCSLYLAAGLPVIIWKEAALADFVQEHGVGIVVESLYELPKIMEDITDERYNEYITHLVPVSKALREGANTKRALMAAEKYLCIT